MRTDFLLPRQWFFLSLLLLSVTSAPAQEVAIDFGEVEKAALAEMKEKGIPGAALAIVKGDKVIYAKGFGLANVETGEAVRPEMLFRLGSTTKMFTCVGLLKLVEEGRVKLDSPVGQYVKGLDPKVAGVTPRQLMTHTSGLSDEAPMFGPHDEAALGAKLRSLKSDFFFTEPGKIYSYSNPGYWLAGLVVEEVNAKPFADAQEENVFRPLGMSHTTFRPTLAMTYPMALGHEPAGKGKARIVRPFADNASTWPAGSMFSSALDLSRFVIAFMNDGRLEGSQVLSPQIIQQMTSPQAKIPGEAQYGYGLNLTTENGVRMVQHGGSRSGYGSLIRMAPDKKVGVINLANLTGTSMPKTCEKALELFVPDLAKPLKKRMPVAMSEAEMVRYTGMFGHGPERETLSIKEGKLWLKRGPNESLIRKTGDLHFSATPVTGGSPQEFVLVTGSDGKIEYLFRGGHSLKKVEN